MKLNRMIPGLLAVAMVMGLSTQRASAQDAPTSKVATANTGQVFSTLKETKDLQGKMDESRKALAQTEQAKRANLNALQESRNQFKPDSQQYQDKNAELMKAAIEFESWGRINQADIQREQKQQMKSIYDKIEAAVAEVSKQKGFDIVIADQRGDIANLEQLTADQLRVLLNQRIVLYSGPKADITNDVIAYMDRNYKGGPASPAPTPAGK